jgi:hypothetical protein
MRTIRLEVHGGDTLWGGERADVFYGGGASPSPPGAPGVREGAYQWWAWSTRTAPDYRPQRTSPYWNILMDFHGTGDAPQANVFVGVDALTSRLFVATSGGDPADPRWQSHAFRRDVVAFVPGKRYDFALGIRWSSDARIGSIEAWVNGARVVAPHHVATLWRGQEAYPKLANYRAPNAATWPNVVYHAGFRRAATRRAVMRCV